VVLKSFDATLPLFYPSFHPIHSVVAAKQLPYKNLIKAGGCYQRTQPSGTDYALLKVHVACFAEGVAVSWMVHLLRGLERRCPREGLFLALV
jgi:hypothetical protein